MKKNRRAKVRHSIRSARKTHKTPKSSKRRAAPHKKARLTLRVAKPAQPQAPIVSGKKAADEIPTLEQVTITCANCGRPFKVFKLKGLSLEGTICQRCSFGEMELPESFGG